MFRVRFLGEINISIFKVYQLNTEIELTETFVLNPKQKVENSIACFEKCDILYPYHRKCMNYIFFLL